MRRPQRGPRAVVAILLAGALLWAGEAGARPRRRPAARAETVTDYRAELTALCLLRPGCAPCQAIWLLCVMEEAYRARDEMGALCRDLAFTRGATPPRPDPPGAGAALLDLDRCAPRDAVCRRLARRCARPGARRDPRLRAVCDAGRSGAAAEAGAPPPGPEAATAPAEGGRPAPADAPPAAGPPAELATLPGRTSPGPAPGSARPSDGVIAARVRSLPGEARPDVVTFGAALRSLPAGRSGPLAGGALELGGAPDGMFVAVGLEAGWRVRPSARVAIALASGATYDGVLGGALAPAPTIPLDLRVTARVTRRVHGHMWVRAAWVLGGGAERRAGAPHSPLGDELQAALGAELRRGDRLGLLAALVWGEQLGAGWAGLTLAVTTRAGAR